VNEVELPPNTTLETAEQTLKALQEFKGPDELEAFVNWLAQRKMRLFVCETCGRVDTTSMWVLKKYCSKQCRKERKKGRNCG